jgi:hypothetical protein
MREAQQTPRSPLTHFAGELQGEVVDLIRFFNTTGPCNLWDHYMLPPEERLVGAQLHRYIRDQLYWVLHAPRQTGKTTFLQNWMREINSGRFNGDKALACYVSVEGCQGVAEAAKAMPDICKAIPEYAEFFSVPVPELKTAAVNSMLSDILINWSALATPKPLVVLFDEVDILEGETLISFLRQLRGGFAGRGPGFFPVSIALAGMRDLKDYITAAKGGVYPNPGSPFNIKRGLLRAFQLPSGGHCPVVCLTDGGGRIEREYAAGRGRMDLAVEYRKRWFILEVKLVHKYETPETVQAKEAPWEDRIGWTQEGTVTVLRG